MKGVIGNREALANFPLIWREFGAGCAVRCLRAVVIGPKRTPFLELIQCRMEPTEPDATADEEAINVR